MKLWPKPWTKIRYEPSALSHAETVIISHFLQFDVPLMWAKINFYSAIVSKNEVGAISTRAR
jgi:hypothetical protein